MEITAPSSLRIPCLNGAQPLYNDFSIWRKENTISTTFKVCFVVQIIFIAIGIFAASFSPLIEGVFLLASVSIGIYSLVHTLSKDRFPPSSFEFSHLARIENSLEGAKALGAEIEISDELKQELEQVIPLIDMIKIEEDPRIQSLDYHEDHTATFSLKSAPDLQFRVCAAEPELPHVGCDEISLARRYENAVYAYQICSQSEEYSSLTVPSVKPVHLQVNNLRRAILAEKVISKEPFPTAETHGEAVRQMVRFLLATHADYKRTEPVRFIPLQGGMLALQELHYFVESLGSDFDEEELQVVANRSILGEKHSLLASLDEEDLIDIALEELKKIRPEDHAFDKWEKAAELRDHQIQKAREYRIRQIRTPLPKEPIPLPNPPPNLLNMSPENLGLDLSLTDYAVVKPSVGYSDGVCRKITLKEVAQVILDRINQKLKDDPNNPCIEFTREEMQIGERAPSSPFWEKHYYYNTLQGFGYRRYPTPSNGPSYWIKDIFQALARLGIIETFQLPVPESPGNPRIVVNLKALQKKAS